MDTSDHEVNVKIGVSLLIASGHLTEEGRSAFLGSLEQEISALVLRNNYLQSLGLSLELVSARHLLERHVSLMRKLEAAGRLDRAVEFLPDDEVVRKRDAGGLGMTRPEIAVLMAYSKLVLRDEILASDLPDAPELGTELIRYFPPRMAELAPEVLGRHRLRREIVSTRLANELVNRLGTTFIDSTRTRTGRGSASIMRAYLIARDVLDFSSAWEEIDALDGVVPVLVQTRLYSAMQTIVDQAVRWFLLSGLPLQIQDLATEFQPGVRELGHLVADLLPPIERDILRGREAALLADGVPPGLAERIAVLTSLSTGMDIVQIAKATGEHVTEIARCYFEVGLRFGLLMLRRQARAIQPGTPWQALAADALIDDAHAQQRDIVSRVLARTREDASSRDDWFSRRTARGSLPSLLTEVARTSPPDLAMLVVASREIKTASA